LTALAATIERFTMISAVATNVPQHTDERSHDMAPAFYLLVVAVVTPISSSAAVISCLQG
jgi:hypothetical protein